MDQIDDLIIRTDRKGMVLRQFMPEDAERIFALIEASRPHLSQFGDDTAKRYPTLDSVLDSILYPKEPGRLRMGIWNNGVLVGQVNLSHRDDPNKVPEIGYWVGAAHSRRGYATVAVRGLLAHRQIVQSMVVVRACTHYQNMPAQRVLTACGFQSVYVEAEKVWYYCDLLKGKIMRIEDGKGSRS